MDLRVGLVILLLIKTARSLTLDELYPSSASSSGGKELEDGSLLEHALVFGNIRVTSFQNSGHFGEGPEFSTIKEEKVSIGVFSLAAELTSNSKFTTIETTRSDLLKRAQRELQGADSLFVPRSLVIFTQVNYGLAMPCNGNTVFLVPGNTFQTVFATNGTTTYAIFNFPNNSMPFFTGEALDGCRRGVDASQLVGHISMAYEVGSTRKAVSFLRIYGKGIDVLSRMLAKTTSGYPGQYILKVTDYQDQPCTCNGICGGFRDCECIFIYGRTACGAKIDCGAPQLVEHAVLIKNSTTGSGYGGISQYKCNEGYVPFGNATRKCQSDNEWTYFSCKAIDCGSLNMTNSSALIASPHNTTFGSVVMYTCLKGYKLEGVTSRHCQSNGHWSSCEPKCQFIDCGVPETLPNGKVSGLAATTYNSLVWYVCDVGYTMEGPNVRRCMTSGIWSPYPPTCIRIDCGDPGFIENGMVSFSSTSFNSTVEYTCNQGYRMVGASERICMNKNTWSGLPPTCEEINCGRFPYKQEGFSVEQYKSNFGSVVNIVCKEGYRLQGASISECQENGLWSDPGQCQEISCGHPEVGNGFIITPFNSTATSTVQYSCKEGFKAEGNTTMQCLTNASWSIGGQCQRILPISEEKMSLSGGGIAGIVTVTAVLLFVTLMIVYIFIICGTTSRREKQRILRRQETNDAKLEICQV